MLQIVVFWVKRMNLNRETKEVLTKSSWKEEGREGEREVGKKGGREEVRS